MGEARARARVIVRARANDCLRARVRVRAKVVWRRLSSCAWTAGIPCKRKLDTMWTNRGDLTLKELNKTDADEVLRERS